MDKAKASDVTAELLAWFGRGGYMRRCDPERRKREGQAYKKGYEVRFVLDSQQAVRQVRRLLLGAGFRPGRTFRKSNRIVLPVYGRATVEWFVKRLPRYGSSLLSTVSHPPPASKGSRSGAAARSR